MNLYEKVRNKGQRLEGFLVDSPVSGISFERSNSLWCCFGKGCQWVFKFVEWGAGHSMDRVWLEIWWMKSKKRKVCVKIHEENLKKIWKFRLQKEIFLKSWHCCVISFIVESSQFFFINVIFCYFEDLKIVKSSILKSFLSNFLVSFRTHRFMNLSFLKKIKNFKVKCFLLGMWTSFY